MFNFGRQGRTASRQRDYEPFSSRFGRAHTQGQLHSAAAIGLYQPRRPLTRPFPEIWAEAENCVFARLAEGVHPENLERKIENDMQGSPMRPDLAHYLRAASRIIRNLRRAGRFDELPSYVQYTALRNDAEQKEEFGRLMRERFGDVVGLRRDAVDDEIAGEVDMGAKVGVEMLMGRNGRLRRVEISGRLEEEGEKHDVASLQQQLAEARQRAATAEARLGMAQPRLQPTSYATERVNLVRHGRSSSHRSQLSDIETRATEGRQLAGRSVNGQFGMRPQSRDDYEVQRGRFSRRFLVEVEGTGPTKPSLVRERHTPVYHSPGAWTAVPSPEGRAPTFSREFPGNGEYFSNLRSHSNDRESEGGVEEESEQQAENDVPPPLVSPAKANGKKGRR